jgi:hypothetical protein
MLAWLGKCPGSWQNFFARPSSGCVFAAAAARVHPGETNASWMMKGVLHQLLGSSAESAQLQEQFVFKVRQCSNAEVVNCLLSLSCLSVGAERCIDLYQINPNDARLAILHSVMTHHGAVCYQVVPMLNPDGVIVGNYRCSLAGLDLNRVWQEPDSKLQPVICAFKGMIKAFMQEREVRDIHCITSHDLLI